MPASRMFIKAARRYGPAIASAAYKRWKAMTPEEKERYRRQMREYAARGREMTRRRGRSGEDRGGRDGEDLRGPDGEGRPPERRP